MKLSLDSSGAVATCELLNLSESNHIVVALDGVLKCGCSNCKLNCALSGLAVEESVDKTAAEGVTAAYTVDDVEIVLLGEAVLVSLYVVEHSGPAVVECGAALTESDRNVLEAELVSELLSNGLVAVVIELTAVDVGSLCLDTEYVLSILLVGDAYVNVLAELGHSLSCLIAGPELAAVVKVARDLKSLSLSSLAGILTDLNNVCTESGSDTGEVEPVNTLEDSIPVEVLAGSLCDSGVSTVVDADGSTLGSALLVEVDTYSITAANDLGGVNAVAAKAVNSCLTDCVSRELCYESRIKTVVSKGRFSSMRSRL